MPINKTYKPTGIGIRQKITVILLSIIMLSLIITGSVYHYKSQESIEMVVVNHLKTVANNKRNAVFQIIKKYQERIALISSRTQLRIALSQLKQSETSDESTAHVHKIYKIITDAKASIKSIQNIIVTNTDAQVVTSSANIHANGEIKRQLLPAKDKRYAIAFNLNKETDVTTLFISQRLQLDGHLIGYAILEMNLSDFSVVTDTQFGLGNSEETTLVYQDPSTGSITPIYPVALTLGYEQGSWVDPFALVRQKDDDITTYIDHKGHDVLAVAYAFKELNLGLVYKIDHADALGIISEQRQFLIISSLATALVGGIVVLILSRTITKPIIDLTYVASMIANGDLSQRIQYFTKDELGMLAQAFNQMADKLIDANQVLEQRVSEKTLELFQANESLARLNRDLELLSLKDALTGISNRRAFDDLLEEEWKRCHRDGTSLGLIMIDIDFFKKYNDSLGHSAGDACLKQVANLIDQAVHRNSDMVARYGGEEFVVLLPNTPLDDALSVAHRIQEAMAKGKILHPDSPISSHVTLSIGLGAIVPERNTSPQAFLEAVDATLYLSKDKGRNTISTIQDI
ncbi:diguanylate cyclase [Vibrio sp. Isolate25]|uniref:sensor domain-containing diguanylate cyclase n=1 Tax=unclassified Vibrio TaxID=2614977 RepID=UPI001EFDAD7C|nr:MULTISPECIES: diguanylate cyclase [unclassified Vibrio]MCG9598253.1 diguanylate cyclase [Vibrio sp. Isolate25]MCG9679424.1 diguanylate cyclase [Vibrio sp. Isolate24]